MGMGMGMEMGMSKSGPCPCPQAQPLDWSRSRVEVLALTNASDASPELPVYSFELEEGEDAVYVVNGVLAMD